jgi:hypothetical protein
MIPNLFLPESKSDSIFALQEVFSVRVRGRLG